MELKFSNFSSVRYHNIFDYKLTKEELIKWQYKNIKEKVIGRKNKSRIQREKYSIAKLIIAKRATQIIAKIPSVKFVGITGSLAMMNADQNSDIDLMIITKNGRLWLTRLISYLAVWLIGLKTRTPKDDLEKDKLCFNMWFDETDLVWNKDDRNIYTAHEIAQIIPLVNKDKTYEKFVYLNRWILNYWPNSVAVQSTRYKVQRTNKTFLENIAYFIQYLYMKNKITREIVTPTRAIFHPNDWGNVVFKKLTS